MVKGDVAQVFHLPVTDAGKDALEIGVMNLRMWSGRDSFPDGRPVTLAGTDWDDLGAQMERDRVNYKRWKNRGY